MEGLKLFPLKRIQSYQMLTKIIIILNSALLIFSNIYFIFILKNNKIKLGSPINHDSYTQILLITAILLFFKFVNKNYFFYNGFFYFFLTYISYLVVTNTLNIVLNSVNNIHVSFITFFLLILLHLLNFFD